MIPTQTLDEKGRHTDNNEEYSPKKDVREITLDEVIEKSQSMFLDHMDETEPEFIESGLKLNPDYDTYYALHKAGALFVLGVFFEDKLVGYSISICSVHLHYKDIYICANDLLYIDPEFRRSKLGLRLIIETELTAKKRGASQMIWSAKPSSTLARLMESKGYRLHDLIFLKEM